MHIRKSHHRPHVFACCAALFALCLSLSALAQDVRPESLGLDPASHSVSMSWKQVAPSGDGTVLNGHRVVPADGSASFTVYTDESGTVLDAKSLGALGLAPSGGAVVSVPTQGRAHPAPPRAPRPSAIGIFNASVSIETLGFGPLDMARVRREDAERATTGAKGVLRTGVIRSSSRPVTVTARAASNGLWQTLEDGTRIWTLNLHSPGALGMRVHLEDLNVPEGVEVIVYGVTQPNAVFGPFPGPDGAGSDVWAPTCADEDVVVECRVPPGVSATGLRFRVDKVVHVYQNASAVDASKAPAGACNLDVTCSPAWATAASGVAGLGSVSSIGSLFCTGTLLADTDPTTDIPYLLTANHCLPNGQTEANTLEIYWFYQTSTCNGATPDILSGPRTTGGADLMANSNFTSGSDVVLVRLRNAPDPGAAFVGWSSAVHPIGAGTTCIHHPRGDFKRITFGNLTASIDLCSGQDPARFHQSTWSAGTTEPGSSGSPLLNDSQQIIGQLWGGCASCDPAFNIDYYGRFDVSFPILESFLVTDPDPDGDTISTIDELNGTYGFVTDPFNADTDGDLVDDWTEILFGTDPTSAADTPSLSSLRVPEFTSPQAREGSVK